MREIKNDTLAVSNSINFLYDKRNKNKMSSNRLNVCRLKKIRNKNGHSALFLYKHDQIMVKRTFVEDFATIFLLKNLLVTQK